MFVKGLESLDLVAKVDKNLPRLMRVNTWIMNQDQLQPKEGEIEDTPGGVYGRTQHSTEAGHCATVLSHPRAGRVPGAQPKWDTTILWDLCPP